MKKVISLIITILLFSSSSFCQLEVIDKIGGLIIPNITKGISEVITTANASRVKREDLEKIKGELQKLNADLEKDLSDLKEAISEDESNVSAIGKYHLITSKIFDEISTMVAISDPDLIDAVVLAVKQDLMVLLGTKFNDGWGQVKSKKNELVNQKIEFSKDFLNFSIKEIVENIDSDYISLQTKIESGKNFQIGGAMNDYLLYIKNMKNCYIPLVKLQDDIKKVNSSLIRILEGYSKSIGKIAKK